MTRIKLIALDLDGTLLNSALKLSEANAQALSRALEQGVQVVLATSRWYLLARRTADRLGTQAPLICSNGAVIRRPGDDRELLHLRLDREVARAVTALGDERGWEMFTTMGETTYMRPRPGLDRDQLPGGLRVVQRQSIHLEEGEPTAVLIFGNEAVEEVCRRFLPLYDGRAAFSLNHPLHLPHYAVLTHPEADKGRALEIVCRELGIAPEETMAMGDSESDIGMLRLAGLGIAMENAPDEVKAAVRMIAPGNDADGVAWAVRRFVL